MTATNRKRKLIEVALPLEEINAACKADKDRKTGTIRNLHKWFAPMPLPAWRALLFAALVDDPVDDNKRVYLLDVIKRLVANGADLPDRDALEEAQEILGKQFPGGLPVVMDPFCGGGSTLVEGQRLGMSTYGSDLNPVPVLITRTLTELLPGLHDGEPLHPESASEGRLSFAMTHNDVSNNFQGLKQDVSYYAHQIEKQVRRRLAGLYPEHEGEVPIAWIWARTAACPNPTCGIQTVLTASWWLSKKRGDPVWVDYSIEDGEVKLHVVSGQAEGEPPSSPKVRNGVFECLSCRSVLEATYIRKEGRAKRLGVRMIAVIAEGSRGRIHRDPTSAEIAAAENCNLGDEMRISPPLVGRATTNLALYGLETWDQLHTDRQLLTLSTFADLVADTHAAVISDGGSREWADAVVTILGLAVGRLAMSNSSQSRLTVRNDGTTTRFNAAFGRNDLPMTWDFPEMNPLGPSGTWLGSLPTVLEALAFAPTGTGVVRRADARVTRAPKPGLVATDPPYFEAIGYADLSDYFYIWHRRALGKVHPDLYATMATPKSGELTAIHLHHGNDREAARRYFIDGFTETFRNLQGSLADDLPMLVVYASKEQKGGKDEETRWSSILTAMVDADLEITGTWPIHGTGSTRMNGQGTNAVASYIVMVCRPRLAAASSCSLSEFNRALRHELGGAVRDLQAASILPVDLAQAAMGPGMQIYSRYRAVLDQSGQRVPVEHALRLINAAREAVLDEQEGELDPESRFAVRWWEAYGWNPSVFDDAAKTARPLGISVDDVARAQVVTSKGNKVQLLGSGDLDQKWVPSADIRPTAWEAVHHLAHRLIDRGGELEAARLMAALGNLQDPAMALVYRLHDIAAKKGRAGDQERYNALINSWAELVKLSADNSTMTEGLF
ncbi:DUF1156 domain-containing protein [Arthrobacter oryzae]|uniref:DUF1156 domain-containing protein n=1 Tax=Arthrobacter oryzae TaxID=409290 RepID=UPI002781958D|nr:DUF1156 domain-containing protein [Arthrobacter oryzae]MDQ0076783.1 putative DNA methylase [Arthrobacter oryzae]